MGRGRGGMMGGQMQQLMQQAQKMQKDMERVQAELANKTVEKSTGGGMVRVVVSCNNEVKELEIAPDALEGGDAEMLQDMLLAALNEALKEAKEISDKEMNAITGGMGGMMPGLF